MTADRSDPKASAPDSAGSSAPGASPQGEPPGAFSVATWNVNKGQALKSALREIAVLAQQPGSVLALQECRIKRLDFEALLRDWLGLHVHGAGRNVIVSPFPFVAAGAVRINDRPVRDAAWADLEPAPGRRVRIYSVHLTYQKWGGRIFIPAMRAAEMERLLEHADGAGHPVVVAGDLNSIGWWLFGHGREPSLRALRRRGFRDVLEGRGPFTHLIFGRLDWIFTRGLACGGAHPGRFALSDHRWLQARLWPETDGPGGGG